MFLKTDKPAYGIDETVEKLDDMARNSVMQFAHRNNITLDCNALYNGRRYCPLEMSILYTSKLVHAGRLSGCKANVVKLRSQFSILHLLLDARLNVCNLDGNFKELLKRIRYRLNEYYNHCMDIVGYGKKSYLNVLDTD